MRARTGRTAKKGLLLLAPVPIVAITVLAPIATAAPATGYTEICKLASDSYVSGTFNFTITGANNYSKAVNGVALGQCTGPMVVPAGTLTVTEQAKAGTVLTAAKAKPDTRYLGTNLASRSVTIKVVVSSVSNNETVSIFWNSATTGRLKVCKDLSSNSADLTGHYFSYSIASRAGEGSLSIQAGAPGTPACKFFPHLVPVGSSVSITEAGSPNVNLVGTSVAPASSNAGQTGNTLKVIQSSGVTTATFTNQATGTVEVCKNAADEQTAANSWDFSVNGGAPFTVHAGQCGPPVTVPAGTATVSETPKTGFVLVGVSSPGGRLLSGPHDNPAKVSVPYGGANQGGNETVVYFTNRVATGQWKICKASPDSTLQQHSFHFDWSYQVGNGEPVNGTADLTPGTCTGLSSRLPVMDGAGNPTTVHVTETQDPSNYYVGSIVVTGEGHATSTDTSTGEVTFDLGTQDGGFTTATYTNLRSALGR